MSRIRIVKGKIYEKIAKDLTYYSDSAIVESAEDVYAENSLKETNQNDNPERPPVSENKILKKFLVHFRRPGNYKGEYGFDWLRDEYIHPIISVTHDNDGSALSGNAVALCKDPLKLRAEYLRDVKNPITPFGRTYYPAWLSIFPFTSSKQFAHGSVMHKDGVNLDLQIDEIDSLISDGTEIILESCHDAIKISPQKISITEVLSTRKKVRSISTNNINYYTLSQKVNVKCVGRPIAAHEEIKVFAKLNNQKMEVGKLMIYKNSVIPKMDITMVNVITRSGSLSNILKSRISDYEYNFKRCGFNQALIRAEVNTYDNFDTAILPTSDQDVVSFNASVSNASGVSSANFLNLIVKLYNKYGKFRPSVGIDMNGQRKTYLFFTELSANGTRGRASSRDGNSGRAFEWGNAYVVFLDGLTNRRTILHEAGHTMGLQHTFSNGDPAHGLGAPDHIFYQGFTDNIMDYTWKQGASGGNNPFDANDKMCSFFKWQWEILRIDRSLIINY